MSRRHPIRVVSRRTGLSPHLIRVWERRYGAVSPIRTPTNRRLYGETDIRRLILIRQLVQKGHGVGQVARLGTRSLTHLAAHEQIHATRTAVVVTPRADGNPDQIVQAALEHIRAMDSSALEKLLIQSSAAFAKPIVLERILCPLMRELGQGWNDGRYRIMHEHMATAVIRNMLIHIERSYASRHGNPSMIMATLVGQSHDMGALMAGLVASMQGWHVLQLGASIPAEEIVAAADQIRARGVGISLVYPRGDPGVVDELRRLRALLPAPVRILAGGCSALSYASVLDEIGALHFPDLSSFRHALDELTWSID